MNELLVENAMVLLCSNNGVIEKIIRNDTSIESALLFGEHVSSIVDEGSIGKLQLFMEEVRRKNASYGWEINIQTNGSINSFNFIGINNGDRFLLVILSHHVDTQVYLEGLMRMNNEQINSFRRTIKEMIPRQLDEQQSQMFYDELSRLNNELATIQRDIMKKNIQLENLSLQKSRFIGMLAHDLRNPLGVIKLAAEYIQDNAIDRLLDEEIEFLQMIERSSEFMHRLVDDVLDMSAIEAGQLSLTLEEVDPAHIILEQVEMIQFIADRKNITLHTEFAEDVPRIGLDKNKISQVIQNLIGNAIKYSEVGSSIWIDVRKDATQLLVSVRDQGQGIPNEELMKLFKPFGTTSVKGTQGEKSTGLGLLISKRIIEGHEGNIWVESEVGVGTTFFFSIPLE